MGFGREKYTDVSIMGIGTNTLGYSNPEVDNAVSNYKKWKYEYP